MRAEIDEHTIEFEPGTTVLAAARQRGIEIPTLCHVDGIEPLTSCFLCVVEVEGRRDFQPACATRLDEGMRVRTNTPDIRAARKTALELLLSDHAGCCVARCTMGCPADLDIPGFIAELRAGRLDKSIAIIKERLSLPGVLGRICPAFCESPCGRRRVDEPLAIKALHRHAADADLASGEPYLPACKPATGKRVAIVGAGPAGLTAAFYLLRQGHACALFDAADRPGGLLRHIPAEQLEQDVVDGELGVIERLGAQLRMRWRLGVDGSLEQLRRDFDAVVLAIGAWAGGAGAIGAPDEKRTVDLELIRSQGLEVAKRGIAVDLAGATSREGVFAAGEAVFGPNYAVRAVAAGRNVAVAIDQFLRGETARGEPKPFYFHRGALPEQEEQVLYGGVVKAARLEAGAGGYGVAEAVQEAGRCLLCGCEKQDDCALRRYAAEYGANGNRFRGERRLLDPDDSHPDLAFETGKCILCGLCLKIAEQEGEPRGLAFSGRGFPTRVVVPFGGSFGDGVHASPARYAEACPTGAISWKEKPL